MVRYLETKTSDRKAGFPRFKSPNRWRSIQLRQHKIDFRLSDDRRHLIVPIKLGRRIKIKFHRPLEGTPKTAHLVLRADSKWYALLACETAVHSDFDHVHTTASTCQHPEIGLNVGINVFLADSDGNLVANPRLYRKSEKRLRRKQRMLSRSNKGSRRRRKAMRNVGLTYLKIARQRRDFLFKIARRYAEAYRYIYVEDLNVQGMAQNRTIAKSIYDASWSTFLAILEDKVERAGYKVVRVPAHFTTQACSKCGDLTPKSLHVRTHHCIVCGYRANRDVNAARNILQTGRRSTGAIHEEIS